MKIINYLIIATLFPLSFVAASKPAVQANPKKLKLWYNKPANYFEEALVLGNGTQGATVFGGTDTDKIFLNDLTLWSGEPVDPYMNKEAYKYLPGVREALKQENYKRADSLVRKIQGKFSESYAPLGTLYLDFQPNQSSNYYRELDLERAIATVNHEVNGNKIKREYFVSHPDKVFVIHLTSQQKNGLNFTVRFNSLLKFSGSSTINHLHFKGVAPVRAEPNYVRKKGNPILFSAPRERAFRPMFYYNPPTGKCREPIRV